MSLLREIQNAAIDSNTKLAVLLRKCKVLAARLGNPEFKQWVESELSGYDNAENLPEYRVLRVNSKGHFSGPFQSGLRNADIPLSCIEKDFHKTLSHSYLTQAIAALESLVEDASGGTLQELWNPDLVAYFGQDIYQGMNCMQAWKVIPVANIVAALDAVRNRILSFVLEIEAESPDAGEAPINSNPVPQEKVHQIFNTYITGNVQNVATGNSNYKVGDEYRQGTRYKREGYFYCDGEVIFMTGSPAAMRYSTYCSDGRCAGLGYMPIEKLREMISALSQATE